MCKSSRWACGPCTIAFILGRQRETMNRMLLKKSLEEARLLFVASFVGLVAFAWLRCYIVSRLEMSSFATIVEQLWDKWKEFSPVSLTQLLSYTGRMAITFDEPIVVFTVSIFAI